MPDSVIPHMIESAGSCVAVHFEPIGWQFDPSLKQWREQRDRATGWPLRVLEKIRWKALRALDVYAGIRFVKGFPGVKPSDVRIGDANKVGLNAAKWSFRLDYNTNFGDLLIRAEDTGSIRIFRKDLNVVGENPFNPASLVGWHRR